MKPIKIFLFSCLLLFSTLNAYSQKYKTAADTVKLNEEYTDVSNDISEISSDLTSAENDLSNYQEKAREANSKAQRSIDASSKQASKATHGDVDDAKNAKKKADKAYDKAQDSQDADNRVKEQQKKVEKLKALLQEKQLSLRELDEMRAAIKNDLLLKSK